MKVDSAHSFIVPGLCHHAFSQSQYYPEGYDRQSIVKGIKISNKILITKKQIKTISNTIFIHQIGERLDRLWNC